MLEKAQFLELLTEFPASYDEKYLDLWKIDISYIELLIKWKTSLSNLMVFLLI